MRTRILSFPYLIRSYMSFLAPLFSTVSNPNINLQQPTTGAQVTGAYNQSQGALGQQQQLANQLASQGGIQNQQNVYNQQQALAQQLQGISQGQGPNPAQAMLAQATGQNVANQAALMAGQRGAGANAGLIARQAAQQGANTQQQAAGQAATIQAQQQLGALGALQQQQQNLANLATQQTGQQIGAVGNLNQLSQAEQGQLLGALQGQNQAQIGQANAISGAQTAQQSGLYTGLGQLGNAIQGAAGAAAGFADGGQVGEQANLKENYSGETKKKRPSIIEMMAHGGHVKHHKPVKAILSPGEIYLNPDQADKVSKGQMSPMDGERIPGKAKVKGDSRKNDTVPKTLEAGGVVIKRTKAFDEEKAKKFVDAVKSRKSK
jgi:hypothetical protein